MFIKKKIEAVHVDRFLNGASLALYALSCKAAPGFRSCLIKVVMITF